ncbi:cation transporter [bacterium]|nr:cation transporter [bacterium]
MIDFLIKIFIKDYKNTSRNDVRNRYGILSSVTGIVLNVILFIIKVIASILTSSIGIAADAFNNLSDAGSSIITFIGFRLAGKPADQDHPFGHGRAEYICSMFVSMLILFMGFELAKSSISKILHPQDTSLEAVSIIILVISVIAKTWMYFFNKKVGKTINSNPITATARDSISDVFATLAVLVSLFAENAFNINIDGIVGLLVSIFILYTGIQTIKESLTPLLGTLPDKKLVSDIRNTILSHSEVSGIHDMIIHNYGPNRYMMSVHAEVPSDADVLKIHDTIDIIEREILFKFNCSAVIHMDPIETNDEYINSTSKRIDDIIKSIDTNLSMHDFRMVSGETHTNLIFDVVVPYDFKMSSKELINTIQQKTFEIDPSFFAVITIDKNYV